MKMRVSLLGAVAALVLCACPESVTAVPGPSNVIVKTTKESPGKNCSAGGVAIATGVDANKDGTLQDSEVQSTTYACNGASTLVRLDREAPGSNCANGGTAVNTGVDKNGDGTLSTDEITSTQYVCDGANGSSGDGGSSAHNSLVRIDTEPPGVNCLNGGSAVRSGLDVNGNGLLDTNEVTSTSYVCNGANGTSSDGGSVTAVKSLIAQTPLAVGSMQCPNGGVSISSGLDLNGNNILDSGEINSTTVLCNGANGASPDGGSSADGGSNSVKQALVSFTNEPAGSNCPNGGTAIHTGLDNNGDGMLQQSEWTSTSYACNGSSAASGFPTGPQMAFAFGLGETPTGVYYPVGPEMFFNKGDGTTRLKITLNTTSRGSTPSAGVGAEQYWIIRMNGYQINPACSFNQYVQLNSTTYDYHLPISTVCVTDPLPAGIYHFDVVLYSTPGTGYAHWNTNGALLVEELPTNGSYNFVRSTGPIESGEISSGTFQNLPQRSTTYTKQAANTLLKVTVADTLRVAGPSVSAGYGELAVFMDGMQQSACTLSQYAQSASTVDIHHPFTMECLISGAAAGQHLFDVRARSGNGGGPSGSTYVGRARGNALLLIEELSATANRTAPTNVPSNVSFSSAAVLGSGASYAPSFAGVSGHSLLHTPAAGKTVKVTYFDTYRNLVQSACGYYGCYALFIDGTFYQQHCAYTAEGMTYSDLHFPVHDNWLIPNLGGSAHTFEIRTGNQASCNLSYFGWSNTHPWFFVEDI